MPARLHLASALVAFSLIPAFAEAAATMSVSPTSGPPTANLTVTLTGFAAGKFVDVYFDTTDECLTLTDGTGAGKCTFKAPADAQPQAHWVSAVVRGTGDGLQKTFFVSTNWQHGHGQNDRGDGFNRYENTLGPKTVGLLDLAWTALPGVRLDTTPVISGGRLFIGGSDGKLYGLNAATGAALYGFPKQLGFQAVYSSPVVTAGNVYVTVRDTASTTKLFAFNVSTGVAVTGFPKTIAAIASGFLQAVGTRLYVGATDGKLYGFDGTNGAPLANFPVALPGAVAILSTPAHYRGLLVVAAYSGKIYAVDAFTGQITFTFDTMSQIGLNSPAVSGAVAYFAGIDRKLRAIDLDVGYEVWSTPMPMSGNSESTPAIADGRVFAADSVGYVYAAGISDGTPLWTTRLLAGASGSPIVAAGVVYVGAGSYLHALDAATGRVLWRHAAAVSYGQNPVVANGMVYVATYYKNGLMAFAPQGVPSAVRASTADRPSLSSLRPDPALKPQ